jgi:putative serine/threonine protein kinase
VKAPVKSLNNERIRKILSYPQGSANEVASRLRELETLGVTHVAIDQSRSGQTAVQGISVLGKGCHGIVLKAYKEKEKYALKIRRTDSTRLTMYNEAEMLKKANQIEIGPRLYGVTKNFILMEYIEGLLLPAWLKAPEKNRKDASNVIYQALEQAWRLDQAGISHGELSQASKHLIVDEARDVHILDFESASLSRQSSNVTALCQYLFLRSEVAQSIRRVLGGIRQRSLIQALKVYKEDRSWENFNHVLVECKLDV